MHDDASRVGRDAMKDQGRDSGFSLAEVIVALGIITAVVLATAPFFYKAIQRTHGQGLRQTAVTVAGQRLDSIRGLGPLTLLTGRLQSDVAALVASPGLVDLSQDNTTGTGADVNYDASAGPGSKAVVPTTNVEQINNTTFLVRTYIDPCYRISAMSACTSSSGAGVRLFRVSVDIAWPRASGETCLSGRPNQCESVTTSLIDPTPADPIFNRDVSQPTVTSMTPVTPTPVTVHQGQLVSVTMLGTNFVFGGIMTSDDPSDVFASVNGNTGSAASANLTAGTAGQRLFRFQNPDGGNGGSAPVTSFTVSASHPSLSAATAPVALAGAPVVLLATEADLYSTVSTLGVTVPPVVAITETSNGVTTALTTSSVSLAGTTLTLATTLTSTKGPYTLVLTATNLDGGTATKSITGTAM